MTLDSEMLDDEYLGEVAPRRSGVAVLLTLLHPSLGYLYAGRAAAAGGAALGYALYVAGFLVAWAVLGFFPVLPLLVFGLGWFLLGLACLPGVLSAVRQQPEYILRGYNHPAIYALVFLFTALVPLHLGYYLSTEVLFGIVKVNNSSMFPSVLVGDVVMIDRRAYAEPPGAGDPVVVTDLDSDSGTQRVRLGRVVAVQGDQVKIEGRSLFVNDKPLQRLVYGDSELPDAVAGETATPASRALVEVNGDRRYVIADGGPPPPATEKPIEVGEGQILVVGDNRTMVGELIPVSIRNVLGRPLYILYSKAPGTEGEPPPQPRWQRVGLRLD